ncbi:photosynthetic reaction center subunit H [Sphingomonas sp. CARO-RG-8B-R24-01]|uniref:photosynthetic reaction center subunit H n=1 Tax=Sphingomonas sp. CARO-RG-8B-R24-01 TaxID=2914831 RepID=UPI001F576025|nr:photosynthetic reaction center subunit H [Sphingomonas sp. CARO-RG-8B-R24-01]
MHPTLTPGIDVAMVVFYAFVLFFLCLVIYLRREDRREGYPLEHEVTGRLESEGGFFLTALPKTFRLSFDRGTVTTPTKGREPVEIAARFTDRFAGAPYAPTGNPLVDGIGPAAYAQRAHHPDIDMEGHPRIVPMGVALDFQIERRDPDPRGMPMLGCDGRVSGVVSELWIDRADRLIRYLAVDLEMGGATGSGAVLVPMMMTSIDRRRGVVVCDAITAAQFADAPRIGATERITLYEEDRVLGYFGGGYLYATPDRQEPYL